MGLCEEILPDALPAIEALSCPSYVIQSPFVNQNGEGMKEYLNMIWTGKNTFRRVPWY